MVINIFKIFIKIILFLLGIIIISVGAMFICISIVVFVQSIKVTMDIEMLSEIIPSFIIGMIICSTTGYILYRRDLKEQENEEKTKPEVNQSHNNQENKPCEVSGNSSHD